MDKNNRMNENMTTNEEMIDNNENNEKTIESNNKFIKINDKTINDTIDETNEKKMIDEELEGIENRSNGCKICGNEDMSNQFFASGPFYAIDSAIDSITPMNQNNNTNRRECSSKCNVLYAEMPQLFEEDIHSNHNHTNHTIHTSEDTNDRLQPNTCCENNTSRHLVVNNNYQFLCYNCCSPLSVGEESQLNHNLFYISNNESNAGIDGEAEDSVRSSVSSPLMLKFCRDSIERIDHNLSKDEFNSNAFNERLSNYTTVIKPKAVRPQRQQLENSCEMSPNDTTLRSQMMSSTLPTLSFHGSTNVLTDRSDCDESAFTQIPRRRSNSEATHHYQSINDNNQMPFRSTIDYSRPLLRHVRSKSVNKAYNVDNNNDLSKCHSICDHLIQNKSNNTFTEKSNSTERMSKQTQSEPIHMTLEEVRNIFTKSQNKRFKNSFCISKTLTEKRNTNELMSEDRNVLCKSKSKSKIKCAIESLFRNKRKSESPFPSSDQIPTQPKPPNKSSLKDSNNGNISPKNESTSPFTHRALPPLPSTNNKEEIPVNNGSVQSEDEERQKFLDYAASIERVKDCGWYWGPISGEMAEKLLATEPCGSFIVRDSSDEHYIFSLTFKLNGLVRHVRIEHDQGNFSFGSLQKFRSNTIVDFIENAVQHSRSGRFLFFLHRRPVMGPMRVQLLHPVSRFKQIQSLQHMCRFIILKHVRRDLIEELPLPKMLKSYLNTPYYYSEELATINTCLNQTMAPNTSH